MTDNNNNLEKQNYILSDEELEHAAGGLVNQVGLVKNPCLDMLGTPGSMNPAEQKSNPLQQNCG